LVAFGFGSSAAAHQGVDGRLRSFMTFSGLEPTSNAIKQGFRRLDSDKVVARQDPENVKSSLGIGVLCEKHGAGHLAQNRVHAHDVSGKTGCRDIR
jgi:hypothetical protein